MEPPVVLSSCFYHLSHLWSGSSFLSYVQSYFGNWVECETKTKIWYWVSTTLEIVPLLPAVKCRCWVFIFAVALDYLTHFRKLLCGFPNYPLLGFSQLFSILTVGSNWEFYGWQSVLHMSLSMVPETVTVYQTPPQFLVLFYLFCKVRVPLVSSYSADLVLLCCGSEVSVLCSLVS
jgi:hypothetical protein